MIPSIISLPLLIIGYISGLYTAPFMSEMYLEFYLIPSGKIEPNLNVLLVAIVVPLIVIIGLSTILIYKMLSKRAINLIKANENGKVGKLTKLGSKILKKAKPQTKFKYSFILSNTNKFIVFFFGITLSSMLIIMGLMMVDFFDKIIVDYYNTVNYVYEGHVDMSKKYPKINSDDEKFISLPNGIYNEDKVFDHIDKDNFYTGVYSKNELNKDDYLMVINKNDILEQTKSMQGFVKATVFIAIIVLYVLTTMTIEDNYYSISMLTVMGYSKKEVNSMMLNSYLVYTVIGILNKYTNYCIFSRGWN